MATYKREQYLLMTTDPVHIGTGGYRLGRVDNSIVREPGTRIPKIPGTSLHGAARSYAAQLYETPEAAGQDQDEVKNPELNPVCYTFGYIKKTKDGHEEKTIAYSGVVNIFDAHILLFPVHSMAGPVWVSTLGRMRDARFAIKNNGTKNFAGPETSKAFLSWERSEPLNLGWLMVDVEQSELTVEAPTNWQNAQQWQAVKDRIVLVNEALFSHIVNSNLEVRTSVAIDPKRGAAEDKALFTYEAIPRATFLTMEVVLDDYRESFPSKDYLEKQKNEIEKKLSDNSLEDEKRKKFEMEKAHTEKALQHIQQFEEKVEEWNGALDVVRCGLKMIEWLGVGGMGTRGFGRMAIVGKPIEEEYGKSSSEQNSEEVSS